jgi:hypothetical protein
VPEAENLPKLIRLRGIALPPVDVGSGDGLPWSDRDGDSTVLVASQDGRFTVFRWSVTEGMVRAHRLEALLM